jgi:hyaluronan synthase
LYTFYAYITDFLEHGVFHLFLVFFAYVWVVWLLKSVLAAFYRPVGDQGGTAERLRTTVLVPVYSEREVMFRRVLHSILVNRPSEIIVVVDGGDPGIARIARDYTNTVLSIPKLAKRAAIERGLAASDPTTDVILIVDSDTIWERGTLRDLLVPFADSRVGGVTPRQSIFRRNRNNVRRFADWIEDLRYGLTVPAQSVVGQVGCLAGRTIAYRRVAVEPAVQALVSQRVFGIEMQVGDDRVLTNEILRRGWRTVYQSRARVYTDAPDTWRQFWKQQLRWGRSSQRETLLSLRWLWKRPVAFLCFTSDIVIPFMLYAVLVTGSARIILGAPSPIDIPLSAQLALAYCGMIAGIGLRQVGHFRRYPRDLWALPVFVLQLTFFMAPTRIAAFATMFHQSWHTRGAADARRSSGQPAFDTDNGAVTFASTSAR